MCYFVEDNNPYSDNEMFSIFLKSLSKNKKHNNRPTLTITPLFTTCDYHYNYNCGGHPEDGVPCWKCQHLCHIALIGAKQRVYAKVYHTDVSGFIERPYIRIYESLQSVKWDEHVDGDPYSFIELRKSLGYQDRNVYLNKINVKLNMSWYDGYWECDKSEWEDYLKDEVFACPYDPYEYSNIYGLFNTKLFDIARFK